MLAYQTNGINKLCLQITFKNLNGEIKHQEIFRNTP